MGRNLVLNLMDHGHTVAVFNRTLERTRAFADGEAAGRSLIPADDLVSFVASIDRPRSIMLMIKSGQAVDDQIDALVPLLDPGDVIIDGGNSLYTDTERRCRDLEEEGLLFVGAGISGGEDGARFGPSIMPGGNPAAWPIITGTITAIAASMDGEPMAAWIGPGGSGHYVKMVHNGIEYGDMQVIAEAYDVMARGIGLSPKEMQQHFATWNAGKLDSYLIEITADILGHEDEDGRPTVDLILDTAGQKGTGKWTVISSMDHGVPVTLVGEAVYARIVSALIDERHLAAQRFDEPIDATPFTGEGVIEDLHDALYASKIVSYAQGFMLLDTASDAYGWNLDLGTIAGLWRAGCVIRSRFLSKITSSYRASQDAPASLLLDDYFSGEIAHAVPGWRRTVGRAVSAGIPTPAYASALAFYDAYRSGRLPANLIQAQRDYFGAHTYERIDRSRGEWFHTDWTGHGGNVTSGTYEA
jgi:6-phosphogluconate dehydrogenase